MRSNTSKAIVICVVVGVAVAAIVLLTRQEPTASAGAGAGSAAASVGGAAASAVRSSSNACQMSPCGTPACDECTNLNCTPSTDGCGRFDDPTDRKLCEDLYTCITNATSHCTNQGDPVRCWCGTNPTTCLGNASGPLAANGPCLAQILAASKTSDPGIIKTRFVDAVFPVGRAVRLSSCRGSFCSTECSVP